MKRKSDHIYSYIVLFVAMAFYLFFAFYDGVAICVDSPSYIEMSVTREFFYPTLLAIFRTMFGEPYLLGIVVLQSILTAYVTWNVTMYCKKQFGLGYVLSGFVFVIQIMVSLLNRFVAGRGIMYSNSILTEGLTIPLFLLFFRYLYEYLMVQDRKSLVKASLITWVLISCRKQMYVALILLFLIVCFVKVTENGIGRMDRENVKRVFRGVVRSLCLCLVLVSAFTLSDHMYNYVVRGRFVGHSSDSRFVLTMVCYTAEEEYVTELPTELQPLYLDIYNKCEEQGYLMHSAGDGWYNNVVHFGDVYDLIQINTMWPAIQQYAEEFSGGDYTQMQLVTDEITGIMIRSLLPKTAPAILVVLFNNLLSGFVTTIAVRNRILIWYCLVAYLGYLGLLLYYRRLAGKDDKTVMFCGFILLAILVNVGLVSAVIFCQTRYTIYNMPLFYISGILLLKALWDKYREMKRLSK